MSHACRRHPSGLYLLCAIEACERFAAGAMLSLFALYLTEHRGLADSNAIFAVGAFLAGSYLASWPGGWLADRWLGALGAARLGAVLSSLGCAALWTDASKLLWPALSLVALGQGLFRPSIAALVSHLYAANDNRRESGFGLFYISVNLGYLAGPLLAELARAYSGWPAVFGIATAALIVASGLLAPHSLPASARDATTDGAPPPLSRDVERARLRALGLLSGVAVIFWLAIQQTGTSLTLFAEKHTERHLSLFGLPVEAAPGHFATLHGALVLFLTPVLLRALTRLRRWNFSPSTPAQFAGGFILTAGAFGLMSTASLRGGDYGRAHIAWLLAGYLLLSVAEVLFGALGMSFVTRVAPPRFASRIAGVWYASIAVGQLLAGSLGQLWQRWSHHLYFVCIALLCVTSAAVLLLSMRWLNAVLQDSSSNVIQSAPEDETHARD